LILLHNCGGNPTVPGSDWRWTDNEPNWTRTAQLIIWKIKSWSRWWLLLLFSLYISVFVSSKLIVNKAKGANYKNKNWKKTWKLFVFFCPYTKTREEANPTDIIRKKACSHKRLYKTTDEFTCFPNWKFEASSYIIIIARFILVKKFSKSLHTLVDVNWINL
jgi:hypothetical protein